MLCHDTLFEVVPDICSQRIEFEFKPVDILLCGRVCCNEKEAPRLQRHEPCGKRAVGLQRQQDSSDKYVLPAVVCRTLASSKKCVSLQRQHYYYETCGFPTVACAFPNS